VLLLGEAGRDGNANRRLTVLPASPTLIVWTTITLVVSALGGLVAQAIGLPAAFLCGGTLAVSLAAVLGMKAVTPTPVRNLAFVIIGVSMGAAVDQNTLSLIGQWPISVTALLLVLVAIISATTIALVHLLGMDRETAFLSSSPGHLSFILGISESGRGNMRQIAVVQSIRVLVLTIAVPIGAQIFTFGNLDIPEHLHDMPVPTLLAVLAACAVGGFGLHRLGVPAGYVLGAMLVATFAKLAGLFSGTVPLPVLTLGFIIMGGLIGSRFTGVSAKELRYSALGGLVVAFLAIGIVTIAALLVAQVVDMPFGQIWIAFAPGGLETMGALGIAFGFDTAFVAAHHAFRLLVLGLAIPFIIVAITRKRQEG